MQKASMLEIEHVRTQINTFLDSYYQKQLSRAANLHPDYERLWQTMYHVHQAGGKRIRPYVMLLAYQAYGGQSRVDVLPVAAALELLHTALLIHDDIIDRDYMRHGQDNVAGAYKKIYFDQSPLLNPEEITHLAHSAALLAGDLAITAAHQLIISSELSDEDKLMALEQIGHIMFVVGGGELLDSETVLLPFKATDPLTIAHLKTADYSLVGPLIMGARLAGANQHEQDMLRAFGKACGIAFQLTDDLLGTFGDAASLGKSVTSDLDEKKRTYLMREAFTLANDTQRTALQKLLEKDVISDADADIIRQLLIDCGAKQATEHAIENYRKQALAQVKLSSLDQDAQAAFVSLVNRSTKRNH